MKAAWIEFDTWMKEIAEIDEDGMIPMSSMPFDVKRAMDMIMESPIPGYDEPVTGAGSCYMVTAMSRMK